MNFTLVTVRANRQCMHCKEIIPAGTKCLTVNKYAEGRQWMCMTCRSMAMNIQRLKCQYDCIPFGDEGAEWAISDAIGEVEENFWSRQRQ